MANTPQNAADAGQHPLWFSPPDSPDSHRRALTRERVVAEALTVISADGAAALSMRALAARLGVVPGALYRHVRSKEQLCDLVADGVLAEVDLPGRPRSAWTGRVTALARALRAVLEDHPGIAALLKTRDPLGPHSLALAEAFLTALQRSRAARAADRPGVLPGLRLHPRLRAQRPHHRQRAARPGHRDPAPAARILPVTAIRPVPRPDRPRRARLGRQPRRTIHRRPRHPPSRTAGSAPPPEEPATRTLTPTSTGRRRIYLAPPRIETGSVVIRTATRALPVRDRSGRLPALLSPRLAVSRSRPPLNPHSGPRRTRAGDGPGSGSGCGGRPCAWPRSRRWSGR